MAAPAKILVIRNDRLGDFMLAYPAFNVLKKLFPSAKIYALVPEYTKPMAELCRWIDEIVIDDATEGFSGLLKTTEKLKTFKFDAALCLHSSPRIALSLLLAGIPHRFAPASRVDQIFYNHRLTQRRSRSEKPEFEYNADLANFMGKFYSLAPVKSDDPPYLQLPTHEVNEFRKEILKKYQLDQSRKIVIVHAGSGGSAVNLSTDQYARLIDHLSANDSLFFILTAGPGEEETVKQVSERLNPSKHAVHYSNNGLRDFSQLVAASDLFISGSTGVLHISGALDTPTAAFYPQKRSATSVRWKTLNTDNRHSAFTITEAKDDGKQNIDLKMVSQVILRAHFPV